MNNHKTKHQIDRQYPKSLLIFRVKYQQSQYYAYNKQTNSKRLSNGSIYL